MIAFISGHIDNIDDEYFNKHYKIPIDNALQLKHSFVIGDAEGIDKMAYDYIKSKEGNITRITKKNFKNCNERDAHLTSISDYDIAYVRTEEEQREIYGSKYKDRKSGTQKNIERRINKK